MSFLDDLLGRNNRSTRQNNGGNTTQQGGTQTPAQGAPAPAPTAPTQRSGGATTTQQGSTTARNPQNPQRHTGAAAAAAQGAPAPAPTQRGGGATTTQQGGTQTHPQGNQQGGLVPTMGQPVALGGGDLAQRMATQALQGNAVFFGVLPDGNGGYAYQGFSSQLEMQAAVQGFSGQLHAQQAQGFATGTFSGTAVLHAEFVVLMDQLGRGIPTPETEHLRVQRIWEDAITGALYTDTRRIPSTARNVIGRTAVIEKANGRVIGYL